MAPMQDLGNRFPLPPGHNAILPGNKTISSCFRKHQRLSQQPLYRLTSEPKKYQRIQVTDKDYIPAVLSWRPWAAMPTRTKLERSILYIILFPLRRTEFEIPQESSSALLSQLSCFQITTVYRIPRLKELKQ